MTGSYLKQLQLTKQLEQRARQAADDRKAAEGRISEAEEALRLAKEYGAETAIVERSLVEATHAFSSKDYRKALELASQSVERATRAKRERVEAIIASARELLDLPFPEREASPEIDALLEEARGSSQEDIAGAFAKASEAWDLADQQVNRGMADLFSRAQSHLLMSEGLGLEVDEARGSIQEARGILDAGEQSACIRRLLEAMELLHASLEGEALSRLEEAEGRLGRYSERLELPGLAERGREIREMVASGHFEEAFSSLEGLLSEGRGLAKRGLEGICSELEERMRRVRSLGGDPGGAEDAIAEARVKLAQEDLDGPLEALPGMERLVHGQEIERLSVAIDSLRERLVLGTRVGMDMSEVMGMLGSSREAMGRGDLPWALEEVRRLEALLDRELEGHDRAEEALARLKGVMREGDRLGASLERARGSMEEARGMVSKGDIMGSIPVLERAEEEVHEAIQERFARDVMGLQLRLATAIKLGVKVAEEREGLDQAISRVRSRQYQGVEGDLLSISEGMDRKVAGATRKTIEWMRGQLQSRRGLVDVREVAPLVEQARIALEDGDYERARTQALEAERALRGLDTRTMSRSLSRARRLIEISGELDCQSVTIDRKFQRIKEIQATGTTREGVQMAKEVIDHLCQVIGGELDSRMARLQHSIHAARKKEVDMTEAEELLNEGLRALKAKDMEKAHAAYVKAVSAHDTINTLHREIYDRIVKVSRLLEEAKVQGLDIKRPLSVLSETKRLFEEGRYNEAARSSVEGDQETERIMAPFIVARKTEGVEDTLRLMAMMKADAGGMPDALEEVRKLAGEGEDGRALSLVKDLERRATDALEGTLRNGIEEARDSLEIAREAGMDTSTVQKLLDRAENLMDADEHVDALRAYRLALREMEQSLDLERGAKEAIEEAEAVIARAAELEIPLVLPEGMLMQARSQVEGGGFALAKELAHKGAEQARELVTNWAWERLLPLKDEGIAGRDMDNVLSAWEDVKDAVASDRFAEVSSLIEGMELAMGRVREQMDLSRRTLEQLRERFEAVEACPETLSAQLGRAEGLMEEGAFSEAFSVMMRCSVELDSLHSMYENRARDMRSLVARVVALQGMPGTEALREELRGVEASLSRSDFEGATREMRRISASVDRMERGLVASLDEEWEGLASLSRRLGEEPVAPDAGGVVELREALESMRGSLRPALDREIERVRRLVEEGEEGGRDVEMSRIFLGEAAQMLEEGRLEEAFEAIHEAEANIGVDAGELESYLELWDRAERAVEEAGTLGIRTSSYRERMEAVDRERMEDLRSAQTSLEELVGALEGEMEDMVPDLDLEIALPEGMRAGEWSTVTLYLINRAGGMARNVSIVLDGVTVREGIAIGGLGVGEERAVPVEVFPEEAGEVEVDAIITFSGMTTDSTFEMQTAFMLDVE